MEGKIIGVRGGGVGENVDIKTDKDGGMHVVQTLPHGAILTALGGGYQAMTVVALSPVVARPSTVPLATLFNGEVGGGKSLIIERAFAHCLVSSAAPGRFAIWLCVHPVGTDPDVADTISTKNSTRGKASYGGSANMALVTGVNDDGWYPWSESVDTEPDGVLPGSVAIAEVNGRIIVPPTASVSIQVVATTVGETMVVGFHWYEAVIDLA